jgi:hypothetical protein
MGTKSAVAIATLERDASRVWRERSAVASRIADAAVAA